MSRPRERGETGERDPCCGNARLCWEAIAADAWPHSRGMQPRTSHSSVAQPLKIMKTRACVIEILSCILETRAPSLKSVNH